MATLRFQAVEKAQNRPPVSVTPPSNKVSDYYGVNVFNEKAMKATISADMYKKLTETIRKNQRISDELADAVAAALKSWAINQGVTHYTHWFQPLTELTAEKHESFISVSSDGNILSQFSGKELIIDRTRKLATKYRLKFTQEEFNKITQMALKPTHLYPSLIMKILADHNINGMAHITGGGLTENIPRSIPEDFSVTINKNAWEMPEIFSWLQEKGNLKEEDMYRVFNCGIGMVLIVNRDDVDSIQKAVRRQTIK